MQGEDNWTMDKSLFKMNVMTIYHDFNSNKVSSFSYLVECLNLWYVRLEYVNFNTLRRLVKMNLLPSIKIDTHDKCEICVEIKI